MAEAERTPQSDQRSSQIERAVVKVESLKKWYPVRKTLMESLTPWKKRYVHAVDDVSFQIRNQEFYGLVGESGCGKTTTGRIMAGLIEPTGGRIVIEDSDISLHKKSERKALKRRVQIVFQDVYDSLNPYMTVLDIILQPLSIHEIGNGRSEREAIVAKTMESVGLTPVEDYVKKYPHQLSGGARQRVAVARALVLQPVIVVADEPVSMLDASTRVEILKEFVGLRDKFGLAMLFITHDLAVARHLCDRIAVMYLGRIVEEGPKEDIIGYPLHPYTRALISSVPVPDPKSQTKGRGN